VEVVVADNKVATEDHKHKVVIVKKVDVVETDPNVEDAVEDVEVIAVTAHLVKIDPLVRTDHPVNHAVMVNPAVEDVDVDVVETAQFAQREQMMRPSKDMLKIDPVVITLMPKRDLVA